MATYSFSLVGGRASVSITDGGVIQILGLSSATVVGTYSDQSVYVISSERKINPLYTDIIVSGQVPSSALDAVTKINTLIGTSTNESTSNGGASSVSINNPTGNATLTSSSVSNAGTVTAGKISIGFTIGSAGTAVIDGVIYEAGSTVYLAPMITKLYPAITYNASGTTLNIITLS